MMYLTEERQRGEAMVDGLLADKLITRNEVAIGAAAGAAVGTAPEAKTSGKYQEREENAKKRSFLPTSIR
jgi:hypothetical protein